MRHMIWVALAACTFRHGNAAEHADAARDATAVADAVGPDAAGPPITFRQINDAEGTNLSTVVVAFPGTQLAGDLAVVAVGWYKAGAVSGVTDTNNNSYLLAIGPTTSGAENQAIYYACNIAGAAPGANVVTVAFAAGLQDPDVRVVEYSGIRPIGCLDVARSGVGVDAMPDSGLLTTTHRHDLLFGANFVTYQTAAADAAYTNRGITVFGDVVEDREVSAIATYRATATENMAGAWVMQLVAFEGS